MADSSSQSASVLKRDSAAHKPSIVSDDQKARVSAVYEEYFDELVTGIRARFGEGPPDPTDVAQESFRRVFEHPQLSLVGNLRAFLWRTARNLTIDIRKSAQVRNRYDFEVEQLFFPLRGDNCSPETVIDARAQLKVINEVLRCMPERRRTAFILRRIDGLTMDEVGRRLGIGRTAAAKHVSKADAELNYQLLESPGESAKCLGNRSKT
ncbi:MAG: sigma-70 family RNA polymerase sigma factor [Pseudomonadota bacterium]